MDRQEKKKGKRKKNPVNSSDDPPISNGLRYCNPFLYRLTINIYFNKKQIQVSIKEEKKGTPLHYLGPQLSCSTRAIYCLVSYLSGVFLDGFQTLNWKVCAATAQYTGDEEIVAKVVSVSAAEVDFDIDPKGGAVMDSREPEILMHK